MGVASAKWKVSLQPTCHMLTHPHSYSPLHARVSFPSSVWYTDESDELAQIANEMHLDWTPQANGQLRGFAMEIKGGRVVLIACDTEELYMKWRNPIREEIPEAAMQAEILMHDSAKHLARERTTIYR
jgi:hypothetical protein